MGRKDNAFDIDALKKRFDTALALVAREVGFEIEETFENQINAFYADYDPMVYDRTGYIYYLSSGYDDYDSLVSGKNLKYTAGIRVAPTNVPDGAYAKNPHHGLKITPRFVYNISYMRGIHGFNRSDLTFMRDKRTGELLRKYKNKKKGVYRKDHPDPKKRNWRPGYKNDIALLNILEREDVYVPRYFFNQFKRAYYRVYNPQDHVPKNQKGYIAPDVMMRREFKKICKSIGVRVGKAMGII